MPITRNYTLSMLYFLVQGLAQAIYDLGGNHLILNLWSGINTSPINAMHAGYGIGAILAIQFAKPFILFDPYHKNVNELNVTLNNTVKLNSNDINLITPYWLASSIAFIFCILFIISQLAENGKRKEYELNRKQLILLSDDFNLDSISSIGTASSIANSRVKNFLEKLFFADKNYNGIYLRYIIIQIALFFIIFVLNQGYFTVISRFMLTYLTLGPAKLEVEIFIIIQTLFWSLFIFGRFFAAYLAFKLDSVKFFFAILIFNLIICSLFLIPFLTRISIFYWICVSLLGLASGPMTPTGLMIAKQLLDINSFVLSLFIVGLALGGILFQQITGACLDFFRPSETWFGFVNPNSAYIIPYLAFLPSFLCVLFFIPVFFLYRKFDKQIKR